MLYQKEVKRVAREKVMAHVGAVVFGEFLAENAQSSWELNRALSTRWKATARAAKEEREGATKADTGKALREVIGITKVVVGRRAKLLVKVFITMAATNAQRHGGDDYYYYEDNCDTIGWNHDNQGNGFMGNRIMLLEKRSESGEKQKKQVTKQHNTIGKTEERGKRDARLGTTSKRPIKLQNRLAELSSDDDDDGNEDDDNTIEIDRSETNKRKINLNRKQRNGRRLRKANCRVEQCPIGGVNNALLDGKEQKWYVWSGEGRAMARAAAMKQSNDTNLDAGRFAHTHDDSDSATSWDETGGSVCVYSNSMSESGVCGDKCRKTRPPLQSMAMSTISPNTSEFCIVARSGKRCMAITWKIILRITLPMLVAHQRWLTVAAELPLAMLCKHAMHEIMNLVNVTMPKHYSFLPRKNIADIACRLSLQFMPPRAKSFMWTDVWKHISLWKPEDRPTLAVSQSAMWSTAFDLDDLQGGVCSRVLTNLLAKHVLNDLLKSENEKARTCFLSVARTILSGDMNWPAKYRGGPEWLQFLNHLKGLICVDGLLPNQDGTTIQDVNALQKDQGILFAEANASNWCRDLLDQAHMDHAGEESAWGDAKLYTASIVCAWRNCIAKCCVILLGKFVIKAARTHLAFIASPWLSTLMCHSMSLSISINNLSIYCSVLALTS